MRTSPRTQDDVASLRQAVQQPSIEILAYQARVLLAELGRITPPDYLAEACTIATYFTAIAEYLADELWGICKNTSRRPSNVGRALSLGEVVHQLYSFLRFIRANSPHQAPPAIQYALSELTRRHFAGDPPGRKISLVSSQWRYNQVYNQITPVLYQFDSLSIDPDGKLGRTTDEIFRVLWERKKQKLTEQGPSFDPGDWPNHIATLSFAGLDTNDTLLFPLLVHELAHFIDHSLRPKKRSTEIAQQVMVRLSDVEQVLPPSSSPEDVEIQWHAIAQLVEVSVRELLADLVATRLLGLSFFMAQSEFLKTVIVDWPETIVLANGYPGVAYRLWCSFEELTRLDEPESLKDFLARCRSQTQNAPTVEWIEGYLSAWESRLAEAKRLPLPSDALVRLAAIAVKKAKPLIRRAAAELVPADRKARFDETIFARVKCLRYDLPPFEGSGDFDFAQVLTAAWIFQFMEGDDLERSEATLENGHARYEKTCRLVLKALELCGEQSDSRRAAPEANFEFRPGALSGREIEVRVSLPLDHEKHLSVVPFKAEAVQGSSLDVHLGSWFVVAKKVRMSHISIADEQSRKRLQGIGRDEHYVPNKKTFVIHPGDFVLGVTMEFIGLPADVMAFVEGKSTIGRTGLLVATATQVGPGFHGVIVLELANAGTIPLEVEAGMAIAQLVFQALTEAAPDRLLYKGGFDCQVKP